MPQVYLAFCLANPINLAVKSMAELNKNSCEEELEKIKINIKNFCQKLDKSFFICYNSPYNERRKIWVIVIFNQMIKI